jgi:hypothetical protein
LEDKTIVTQVLAGNIDAFERLFEKYRSHVTAIVQRHVLYDRVDENEAATSLKSTG